MPSQHKQNLDKTRVEVTGGTLSLSPTMIDVALSGLEKTVRNWNKSWSRPGHSPSRRGPPLWQGQSENIGSAAFDSAAQVKFEGRNKVSRSNGVNGLLERLKPKVDIIDCRDWLSVASRPQGRGGTQTVGPSTFHRRWLDIFPSLLGNARRG